MMNFVLSLLFASLALGLFAKRLDWRAGVGFGLWTLGAALFYYVRH